MTERDDKSGEIGLSEEVPIDVKEIVTKMMEGFEGNDNFRSLFELKCIAAAFQQAIQAAGELAKTSSKPSYLRTYDGYLIRVSCLPEPTDAQFHATLHKLKPDQKTGLPLIKGTDLALEISNRLNGKRTDLISAKREIGKLN